MYIWYNITGLERGVDEIELYIWDSNVRGFK